MFNKLFILKIFVFFVVFAFSVFIQTQETGAIDESSPDFKVIGTVFSDEEADFYFQADPKESSPEIYVHDLVFDQIVYATGETITGQFTISNAKNLFVSNLYYKVQLVGNFNEAGFPTTIFETGEALGPIDIDGGDKKRLNFSYKIPEKVGSSDLGIQIQTYLEDGRPSARKAGTFAITGPIINYLKHVAQVQVDGEPFALTDGPIVYKNEKVFFAVSLNNDTSSTVTVTPSITVYDNLLKGRNVDTFDAEMLSIGPHNTKEQRIELPTFEYSTGVYTAIIKYRDSEGMVRSGPFEVKYIISGNEPKIDLITVNRTSVGKGEPLNVSVKFVDAPLDIRVSNLEENRKSSFDDISAEVSIYDANKRLVDTKRSFFEKDRRSIEISLISIYDMKGFYVVVNLYRGESIIDSVEKSFPDKGEITVNTEKEEASVGQIVVIAAIFFGITIVLIVFIFLFYKKREKEKNKLVEVVDSEEGRFKQDNFI